MYREAILRFMLCNLLRENHFTYAIVPIKSEKAGCRILLYRGTDFSKCVCYWRISYLPSPPLRIIVSCHLTSIVEKLS